MSSELPHLDEHGHARMVDVGGKPVTERTATAVAVVRLSPATAARIADGTMPKGDVAAVARVAGIQAAKRTPELIPLCHQIALSGVDVAMDVDVDAGEVRITVEARAADRTGVEMEALTGASVAALTIYDMVKGVDRDATIGPIGLEAKSGGRTGTWRR